MYIFNSIIIYVNFVLTRVASSGIIVAVTVL